MEKKLEVKNLQISFRTQGGTVKAVRDVSFDVYKGETLAIVGESGSGKSVTSKAVMGILAGNSIVEGGEILYDGQDLMKISEEDFHKIRGDKISMIFQDPMSSLNPIMRVGQQLTEAMILKGKTSQKNARKMFNSKLKSLNSNIDFVTAQGNKEKAKQNALQCSIFDKSCIKSTVLEEAYNNAYSHTVDLQLEIDNILFLIEKKQKVDLKKKVKEIIKKIQLALHPYVVTMTEDLQKVISEMNNYTLKNSKEADREEVLQQLKILSHILNDASNRQKPNYFTLGYYMMKHPEFVYENTPIDELDAMTRAYIDEDFMLDFIKLGEIGVKNAHEKSIEKKKKLLVTINEAIEYFRNTNIDKKVSFLYASKIAHELSRAINRLAIKKTSIEYSINAAFFTALNAYFTGVKKNPKEELRYEKQMEKHRKAAAVGKILDWKVVPAITVDLDLARSNIRKVLHTLADSIKYDIENENNYNVTEKTIELIDFFKEQASKVVYKVTKKMAKAKALKLLEEVGIPEPAIRFNQYPFEFSGGMRQRIVIAIALSADPDILICDEPTTALDVTIQSQILELINKLKVERDLSVIFITHDLGVVANMADRIAVMYAGKIVEYGTANDIFYEPKHPYTWALLSSMPDLDTVDKLEAIPGTPPNMIFPPKGDAFAARNKYALEIDFEEEPPLFEVSETHFAATWLLHPNAPKVELPKIITNRVNRMKEEVAKNGRG